MAFQPSDLLDPPPYPVERYAPLADRARGLFATANDVVFVQAEAILALEAAASSLGNPGIVALNVVTSAYGTYFGTWLKRGGAEVHNLAAETGKPITVDAVKEALDALPRINLVAVVHAETATGILNPLTEIAAVVRERGALFVVDAVASFGGHPLPVDQLGIDVAIVGPQKALGGPTALSLGSVSRRAWREIAKSQPRLSPSNLALGDIKDNWLEHGRRAPPGMPAALEFWALDAALARVEAEGLAQTIARHERAARATRSGVRALGAPLWIEDDAQASTLMTAVLMPDTDDLGRLVSDGIGFGGALSRAPGALAGRLVRLDHTGFRTSREAVLANLNGLGLALRRAAVPAEIEAATAAAEAIFAAS